MYEFDLYLLGLVSLPSLHLILSVTIPTLRHVPKGARDVWAGVVGDVFRAISGDPSNLDGWAKFFYALLVYPG